MRRIRLFCCMVSGLSACVGSDKVSGETETGDASSCLAMTWYLDRDEDGVGITGYALEACVQPDGYAARPGDCDDDDDAVSPAASEACNEIDDDCDGEIDESGDAEGSWYWDLDGDGWGGERWTAPGCVAPEQTVQLDGDCDDTNSQIHPDGEEICNGLDDDCDTRVDDNPSDDTTWYRDADSDGQGGTIDKQSCDAPDGYVSTSGDCDDDDPAVNSAADERCDGLDNDCDAQIDEYASDATTWYRDADDDGAGTSAATRDDCEQPDGFAPSADDCDDDESTSGPLAPESCGDGLDNDCDGAVDPCSLDMVLAGWSSSDQAGSALTAADLDGDGQAELLVGAPYDNQNGKQAGAVVISASLYAAHVLGDDEDLVFLGEAGDQLGGAVAAPADLDGDGMLDLILGASDSDRGAEAAGAVWLKFGPHTTDETLDDSKDAVWTGDTTDGEAGATLSSDGDVDGDGASDLLVGAPALDLVYLIYGGALQAGASALSTADAVLSAEVDGDLNGAAVLLAQDLDGDGLAELVTGASKAANSDGDEAAGAVYSFSGDITGALSLADADHCVEGAGSWDRLGEALANAGDLDGDGYADLLVGATGLDGDEKEAGGAYLLSGPLSSGAVLPTATLLGLAEDDEAGETVGPAGDVNGDGLEDLFVGASRHDRGGADSGGLWIVLGPVSGALSLGHADRLMLGAADDRLGRSATGLGDVDGDGLDDVAVGAPKADDGGSSSGAVLLLLGY